MKTRIRSTNKEVKAKIQAHIIGCLDPDNGETLQDKLQAVVTCFKSWSKGTRYPSQYMAFESYLQCLPSTLSVEFTYHEQEKCLVMWLGSPEKDYGLDDISNRYYSLVYREFKKLCEQHGIQL